MQALRMRRSYSSPAWQLPTPSPGSESVAILREEKHSHRLKCALAYCEPPHVRPISLGACLIELQSISRPHHPSVCLLLALTSSSLANFVLPLIVAVSTPEQAQHLPILRGGVPFSSFSTPSHRTPRLLPTSATCQNHTSAMPQIPGSSLSHSSLSRPPHLIPSTASHP
ncbi:hypothetical protein M427DRAFT_310432 [Gonapodya prolifera JEL478]|uniref:Uncharacterized protein n=1 Tax=Gonapodya prolifera (strain JEL478) TaxID=1344416 RepID=A0A139AGE4_GONPJ|nr:hypothetical protein M427DRAFT_310432 [Gonapodya prolifera JEL478]|eukprot:KXS15902.1 hypothetical protein M427DRAFT_310432 [Gonapodya prolifera JEL478]